MKVKIIFIVQLFTLLFSGASAQIYDPVKWRFDYTERDEDTVEIRMIATIESGWHIYAQNIKSGGPLPTEIAIDTSKAYELAGEVIVEGEPIEKYDPTFQMDLGWYEEKVTFIQQVKLIDPNTTISGKVSFMACNDERCLPPEEVEFDLKPLKRDKQSIQSTKAAGGSDDPASTGLWAFMLLAFASGLAALLTPCVFPMIPLTVSFFSKPAEQGTKRKNVSRAILYGVSIIIIYVMAGSLVARLNGPGFANWLSTHWLPNIFFFIVFMIFAASFLGMFDITLPSRWVNAMDKQSDRKGMVGIFFMAFTLVLVSFSCTAPIVGNVLVLSAGGEVVKPIAGMFAFSFALAMPFSVFAAFPKWLNKLPRSGGWLNSVKVVLGFLELALGLKFLSVVDQVYHWGLLDRDIFLALWIVIFTFLGFYLIGKIKLPHDGSMDKIPVPRVLLAMVIFAFVVYLIPGLIGAPLKPLSGYLPPMSSQDFNLMANQSGTIAIKDEPQKGCEKPMHEDLFALPHGLQGYFDVGQALACSKAQNKPVFVDFTGHGCVNCREMEARVWSDPEVLKRLREDYIIVALYVDDKTALPESEWIKSSFDGKIKDTIGEKNADYQITKFNNNAQPFYVLMDHNEQVLADPGAYDLEVNHFIDFLDEGKRKFHEQNS